MFDGVDVAFNARLGGGVFVNGGVATGRIRFDQCEAFVDNPADDLRPDRCDLLLLQLHIRAC